MLARTIGLGPPRPGVTRWSPGKRTALQFAGIVIPPLASFALSAFAAEVRQLQVSVSDRGAGLPAAFDPVTSKDLGMQVAALLMPMAATCLRR